MLKRLQYLFLLLLAVAVAAFATWRYFEGGAWWLAAIVALGAYAAVLSGFLLGSKEAWHGSVIRFVFDVALSNKLRASISVVLAGGAAAVLCVLAYWARPADTDYYEVRVYEQVDLPTNYHVGARVVLHSRTDGLTHERVVDDNGGALFRSISVPTTVVFQVTVMTADPPFVTGGSDTIDRLPDHLAIDTAIIPIKKRLPILSDISETAIDVKPRPAKYLANLDERGDKALQPNNAPWGVPHADIILNRLGYVLGYDLARRMPRWVAYAIGPTEERVPRTAFRLDPAIASDLQAGIADYRASDFDRGHLISPADLFFRGPVATAEAFYMSTVSPQTPWLNRNLWRVLESHVRETVASRQQPAFVIAGPLFIAPEDEQPFKFDTIGQGRIPIPTHFFRIIATYDRDHGIATVGLIAPNATDGTMELDSYLVTINEIEEKSGLDFFPLLDDHLEEQLEAYLGNLP